MAADVGVNVALISRYFGSKEGLFQTVIAFDRILEKVVFYEELHDGKAACRRLRSISGGI
ncbi:MAG: TetR family transcriptional regulator [Ktedonobacteraceae bacterium]